VVAVSLVIEQELLSLNYLGQVKLFVGFNEYFDIWLLLLFYWFRN
jgi:hypothetical protein